MKKLIAVLLLSVLAGCATTPAPEAVKLEGIPNLSPEQIRALPSDQIEALGQQANAELELFANQLRAQTTIRWPNYNDTLYVATGITFETYLSSYYRQTNGPDWTDDGCSGPTPPVIFDANACRQHDFGYRNVPKYAAGRNETVRKSIDERFLSNMYLKCDRYWNHWYQAPLRLACKGDALVFYAAVRNFGSGSYYSTAQTY